MQAESIEVVYQANHPWRTLFALFRPERKSMGLGVLAFLFKASPLWVIPVVTANIVDLIAHPRANGMPVLWWNTAIGAFFIAQNVPAAVLFSIFSSRAIRSVEIRLRSALVRRLQMLSIAYHSQISTAVLQTKVLRDVESIEQLCRQLIDPGLGSLVTIAVAIAVTSWRMPQFLPVFALLVPLAALIRYAMSERLKRYNHLFRKQLEAMNTQVLGMINMIPVTRAHAVESEEILRVESRFGEVRNAALQFDRHASLFGATAWVAFMLFNLVCLTLGAWLSLRGIVPFTPGDIVLVTGYFNAIIAAVMQLNNMLPIITRGFDGLRSLGEVLECPDLEENRDKQPVTNVNGAFRFEGTSYDYRDETGAPRAALQNLTLEVKAGETIGVVGSSGSGKSTLMSLIIGFHRPTAGRILLDGVEMNTIDLRSYRRRLSVVGQETILFEGTLRENIVYGTQNVTEAQLQAAIEAANAAAFIKELPHGLATEIGERGARLSGGQRQRIAIARALLRDPRILILDEATSALDAGSEVAVQQALDRLMQGRTTFIVAHRLSTLRNVDRIIVLEHGQIVESGTPAELGARPDGRFAQLQRMHLQTAG
ncbi:MAG: ABC transporter ATP-binding protein [Chthoniobacteraceae bacterium]